MSRQDENEEASASAYAVPSEHDDVVTTVCRIVDEDLPQPMKGMRKANKVPNAADQFSANHHGEYEARGRRSANRIDRVHRHNQACPKLYDELNKRPSASRVIAVTMSRKDALHLTKTDKRIKMRDAPTPKYTHRRSGRKKGKEKSQTIKNRLAKRRNPKRKVLSSRLSKIWKSKGCQCQKIGAEISDETKDDVVVWKRKPYKQPSRSSQQSFVSERHPGTTEPSLSSYHSFSSMEHEPMVS
ncbi:uncharacterized protein LOC132903833 [Amyelois transitella]|uniref:uncharacterized protein LOC132903833 n=1 Tax=Amyelois transitella TaxID=680683 RepID=UPI00298FEFF3|nr:uncharacterized protein LOC132903833 [Amyelois transitella]